MSYTNEIDIDLIINYPSYKWDWSYISKHINIIFINKYSKLQWDWIYVVENKTITENFVIKYLNNFKYFWYYLAGNAQLSIQFILQYYEKSNNIYYSLSFNRNLDINYLLENLDLPWNFHGILLNHASDFCLILKISHKLIEDINWYYVSLYLEDFNNVIKYPNFSWNFEGLSRNKRIKLNDVLNITEVFTKLDKIIQWEWDRLAEFVQIRKSEFTNNSRISSCFANLHKYLMIDDDKVIHEKLHEKYKQIDYQSSQNIYTTTISPCTEVDLTRLVFNNFHAIRYSETYIEIDYIKYVLRNVSSTNFNKIIEYLMGSKFITLIDIVTHPEIPWKYDQFYFTEKNY